MLLYSWIHQFPLLWWDASSSYTPQHFARFYNSPRVLFAISRNERTHPNFVLTRLQQKKFDSFCEDCKLPPPPPLGFLRGFWPHFRVLCRFVASFVTFDVLGFSLNCICTLIAFDKKGNTKKGQQLFILSTNTTLNHLGFRMLTVGTAIFHWLYFDSSWFWLHLLTIYFQWPHSVCIQRRSKVNRWKWYSEATTHKSNPELRNSSVNADYFYSSAEILNNYWTRLSKNIVICQNIICSKTPLDGITHEQTIICRQLFAGHLMGSRPMKRKEKMHRMINNLLPVACRSLSAINHG